MAVRRSFPRRPSGFRITFNAADVLGVKGVVAGSAVAVALAGCGGGAEATDSADCLSVPTEVMGMIAEGALEGSGFVAKEAAAVLGTGDEVYFVAMRFDSGGQSDMVGVWSTTFIAADESSGVISVDGFAKQFTHWPDAEQAFDISPAHPPALAAKDCLG